VIDALIAATAVAHGMTVVTRNTKGFERAGVQVLSPSPSKVGRWQSSAETSPAAAPPGGSRAGG
jgi:hypothetical protein